MNSHNKSLAAHGLKSYRYKGRYGYIMIGATDHKDALKEAARSTPRPYMSHLEQWDGERGHYVAG